MSLCVVAFTLLAFGAAAVCLNTSPGEWQQLVEMARRDWEEFKESFRQ